MRTGILSLKLECDLTLNFEIDSRVSHGNEFLIKTDKMGSFLVRKLDTDAGERPGLFKHSTLLMLKGSHDFFVALQHFHSDEEVVTFFDRVRKKYSKQESRYKK